jgi:hypothetical protein
VLPLLGSDLLAIYLNDHLAGSTAGLDLARRSHGSNEGTDLGDVLERLAAEIAEDRAALERMMDRLDVGRDHVKVFAGWAAEKVGRLKLNGQLTGYSPLSRVVELEGLIAGVSAKKAGWRALRQIADVEPRLDPDELDRLIARADRQLRRLWDHHRAASAAALTRR